MDIFHTTVLDSVVPSLVHALLVYHNLHGDLFFVKKVKRWCSSALEREYLKTHSRDIMPAYSPTDKQVNQKPDEQNISFFII